MLRTDFRTLDVEARGGVVQLVLNRPDVRNAISHEMQAEIDAALDEAEVDPDVTAVVLRGAGDHFSAGHDLKEQFGGKPFEKLTFPHASPSVPPRFPRAWYFRKPLIGAIHGYVGAYAVALVGCFDFTIAADDTRFSCEVFKGTYPDVEWLPLYLQFPMRVIEKFWLLGGWMDAEQALHFQFVQRVLPRDQVVDEALRWAQQVSLVPAEMFAVAKDKIRRSFELLGLNSLTSVLDQHPQPDPERVAAMRELARDEGVAALVRRRDQGFDPAIAKI